MKLVLAIVRPFKVEAVSLALSRVEGFPGLTVTPVRGFGREHAARTPTEVDTALTDLRDNVQIEAVVPDSVVDEVLKVIGDTARTGRYGDGMAFVLPVERALRIASLAEGEGAV